MIIGAGLQAQDRYLEEVFTDSEITVVKNVTYGINVNPLLNTSLLDPTYVLTNQAQIAAEKDSLQDYIATDPTQIPASFFTPYALDTTTELKITQLNMDVYMPSMANDTVSERPVIVYVHTGNFLPPVVNGSYGGSKEDSSAVELCRRWAKRGFVAVAPNYRHGWNPLATGSAGLITRRATLLNAVYRAIHDVQFAIKGLRLDATAGANTYGIDVDNFAMYGVGSGGYVALAYNTLDDQAETEIPKFVFNGVSVVQPAIVGDFEGNGGLINLYVDNGMSYDVDICVNAGGALGAYSWMEAGDGPFVTFHSPYDNFAPFDTGTVIVPTTGDDVVDVNGPNTFMVKANSLGLNDGFFGVYPGDPYTAGARRSYGKEMSDSPVINVNEPISIPQDGVEGLYTFVLRDSTGDPEPNGSPWEWWDKGDLDALVSATNAATGGNYNSNDIHASALQTNPNQSATQANLYIDTIMGYMMPRVVKILQIGNWESVNVNEFYMDKADVSIYPNPASSVVIFKSSNASNAIASYQLNDMMGRTVFAEDGINDYFVEMNVDNLGKGVYVGTFTLESGEMIQKKFTVE